MAAMSQPTTMGAPSSSTAEIEAAAVALQRGADRLRKLSLAQRRKLLDDCIAGVTSQSHAWVERACTAKSIPAGHPARAEEIMTGPLSALRYLHLLDHSLLEIERYGQPRLPGRPYQRNGRLRVPVFPTPHLYDRLLFRPMRAETWMQAGVSAQNLFGSNIERVSGSGRSAGKIIAVLGAGNVSSIPITDTLSKLFQDGQSVLLKMNPVNEYLGPIFEQAFAALIQQDLLRIVYGGAMVGTQLVQLSEVDAVHITGSDKTHDAIVWGSTAAERQSRKRTGDPLLKKQITSELGNVSPWIILPGKYSTRQLYFQAENIVASIANNASFNCIATKMLITWQRWPQRKQFLDQIESILTGIEPRSAYYPGAAQRYARFAGMTPPQTSSNRLPWTLLRDIDPRRQPHLFNEESFVCVCGETAIQADTAETYLSRATTLANDRMWGTLAVALTVPRDLQRRPAGQLDKALGQLRYGTIGVNQWPGVAFALMSPPWGGFPGTTLEDVQSGIGTVHNTYLLNRPEKTVLSSPLTMSPKPMWFSTHRAPEAVAWRLLELYQKPSLWRLPPVLVAALRG